MVAHNFQDISGKTFGRLTVESLSHKDKWNQTYWKCRCDCGKETIVTKSHLTTNHTKSCGCYLNESRYKHGCAIGSKYKEGAVGQVEKTYRSWQKMKDRCNNCNNTEYNNYGGRGIKVCDRWVNSFENFLEDMGIRPTGKSLDRYPNLNGNYEPNNCRWASNKEQSRNRRGNLYLEFGGETKLAIEWAEIMGVDRNTVIYRNKMRWSLEKCMNRIHETKIN
jgi:hypothetical protein